MNTFEKIIEREEYQSIVETIKNNDIKTKSVIQQRKLKKINNLKQKPNSATEHKTGFRKNIYKCCIQGTNNTNINVSITHKCNNTNAENKSQTLLKKLKTLNKK